MQPVQRSRKRQIFVERQYIMNNRYIYPNQRLSELRHERVRQRSERWANAPLCQLARHQVDLRAARTKIRQCHNTDIRVNIAATPRDDADAMPIRRHHAGVRRHRNFDTADSRRSSIMKDGD
jgi:hypothetical protein